MTSQPVKHVTSVLVLGDSGIGKTSLARTITKGVFPSVASLQQDPPRTDLELVTSEQTSIHAGDTTHVIKIFDQVEDLAKERQIDVVYLCFDISCQATFDAIQKTWLPRAKLHMKETKKKSHFIILTGLKFDLVRPNSVQCQGHQTCHQPISRSLANELVNKINASCYVEVSALKYLGIEKLKEQTVFISTHQGSETTTSRLKDKCHIQ